MAEYQDNLVSLVMRTVGGRPREIRRALASVMASTYRPIEAIIVYQGSDPAEQQFLHSLSEEFEGLTIRIFNNAEVDDRRAENLNIGWEAAHGRYLGFLDDDDTLEPEHFALLLAAMQQSNAAWSYAQSRLRKEDDELALVAQSQPFQRHRFSVVDLWIQNFIPIHSFLVDRASLIPELCLRPFCEELDRSEDWDFLIRLSFFHKPEVVDEYTSNYYVSTGSRNTNLSLTGDSNTALQEVNRQRWARCKALVEKRKGELLERTWWAKEFFSSAVTLPASMEVGADVPGSNVHGVTRIRRRIMRALIRRLELFL